MNLSIHVMVKNASDWSDIFEYETFMPCNLLQYIRYKTSIQCQLFSMIIFTDRQWEYERVHLSEMPFIF